MYAHPPIGRSVNRSEINAQARLCYPRNRQPGLPAWAQPDASNEIAAIRSEIIALTARLDRLERRKAWPMRRPLTQSPCKSRPGKPLRCASWAICATATSRSTRTRRGAAPAPPARTLRPRRRRHGRRAGRPGSCNGRRRPSVRESDSRRRVQPKERRRGPRILHLASDRGFRSVTGGKMATPFFRPGNHHLIYDNDLNPEGLALRYRRRLVRELRGLWVEERSSANDSILLGGQFGYRGMLDNGSTLPRACLLRLPPRRKARHRFTTARARQPGGSRGQLSSTFQRVSSFLRSSK